MEYQYNKEDLQNRLDIVHAKGEKIQKCLEYAIARLGEYHSQGAKGLIVDDAVYDVYTKLESALNTYKSYNNRVVKKIEGKLADMTPPVEEKKISSIPRRSI